MRVSLFSPVLCDVCTIERYKTRSLRLAGEMEKLSKLYYLVFGPRLYAEFKPPAVVAAVHLTPTALYQSNSLEYVGDVMLSSLRGAKIALIWFSPLILPYLYRRGLFSADNGVRVAVWVVLLLLGGYALRAAGRLCSSDYRRFVERLKGTTTSAERRQLLAVYDFDLFGWPADYEWREPSRTGARARSPPSSKPRRTGAAERAMDWLSWAVATTFGRRLLYPGSVTLLNAMAHATVLEGRRKLVEEQDGQRCWLKSSAGDMIDALFVDKRNRTDRGSVLVVGCEGNAGFYEIGTPTIPLERGYSVLGWNHPGFAQSTGVPWPRNDAAAADVVVQYAINRLGFAEENIVIYAWSIGGFAASSVILQRPKIGGLILDATFDKLGPLAKSRMPESWAPLVERTVDDYLELPIAQQIDEFDGPILLIRRSLDDMIVTDVTTENSRLRTNRANNLLHSLLRRRYPDVYDEQLLSEAFLAKGSPPNPYNRQTKESRQRTDPLQRRLKEAMESLSSDDPLFPLYLRPTDEQERKELLLFLAHRHFVNYESGHNTPLQASLLNPPTQPWE